MKPTFRLRLFTAVLTAAVVVCSGFNVARAALVALDNAGNYGSSWAGNGGSGFGAWSFANSSGDGNQNGSFLATSSGNLDLSIATSGKGWGLYANNDQTANAIRPFSGTDPTLSAGQSFKISMDNGSVNSPGSVGFSLRNSSHANRFEFYFVGGGSNYKINVNGVETDTGIGFTSAGLNLVFQQNANNAFSFSINGSPLTGSLLMSDISEVRVFDFNSGNNNNVYFNSLEVTAVPEPANVALLVFGSMTIASVGLRRFFSRQGR